MEGKLDLSHIAPIKSFAGMNIPTETIPVQTFEKQPKKKNFTDPLMKWPVRGMAFTNDIGAAIMDIAPKAGTAFWVPALMYFGADIYDKYRNDKESYNPNARRGLKQALFQTFASIVFPIAAVHAGQKTASIFARSGKNGLSLQTQEEIINHHKNHMAHVKLRENYSDVGNYKNIYGKALDNYIDETMRTHKYHNPFKLLINLIFGHKHPEELGKARRAKVHDYINNRIDEMFKNREDLLQNKKPEKMSVKLFAKFQELQKLYKKDSLHINDFVEKAAKDTLKSMEEAHIFKLKLIKTAGGFAALGLLIKPIDKFVENIIIKKFIGPGLDKFESWQVNEFKEKIMNKN